MRIIQLSKGIGFVSVKPITPNGARKKAEETIPDQVIEAFNELISENIGNSSYVTILQKDAIKRIKEKMPEISTDTIFAKRWLDIEQIFRKQGWKVEYDKPAYCETYEANWTFKG